MADIPFPRGVKDLMPNEALFRNELLKRIESVFQLFGFLTIDTPSFESLEVLKAKNAIGSDTKLIYELNDDKLGLRYDHTVSLARYIAMRQELPMPFRRYYIGKLWRREEPQRLRYREITQADVDIIGGNKAMADAEVIGLGSTVLESIGLEYKVCINDRMLMDKIFEKFGVGSQSFMEIMRIIDKLYKIGDEKVATMLKELKLDDAVIDQITSLIMLKGTNDEKLDYVDKLLGNKKATGELRTTLTLLKKYSLKGDIVVDFSIVRGLDYYTGMVVEYKYGEEKNSLGGGGRYDNLIGRLGGKELAAVGISLGIDRILNILDYSASIEYTYANVFVAYVNEKNYPYALGVANSLRSMGIPTDINISSRNLSNQFAYASSIKTKYVIIIGDAEEKLGKLKLRNLISGDETVVEVDEAVNMIKGK